MNKAPEEMKINDALDLFEENGAKIAFFNGRCNVDEQFGKVMRKKKLYNPTTDEDRLLVAQLGKAADLIYERLRDKTKKEELKKLLALREQYRPENGGRIDRTEVRDEKLTGQTDARSETVSGRKKSPEHREREAGRRTTQRREEQTIRRTSQHEGESTGKNTQHKAEQTEKRDEEKKSGPLKIEYARGKRENGAGNTVQILEIPSDSKGINVPLKTGGRLKFTPPVISEELIKEFQRRTRMTAVPDVKRYLVIEMTPDKKTMFLNIVYGNLDLEQMANNSKYLELCMTTMLERKRINDVCRNYFCTLDDISMDAKGNVSLVRNNVNTFLVVLTLLNSAHEIRTTRKKGFFDSLFGDPQKPEEENILKIFKTGVIMVNGKECAIYSYGTKDETMDISEGKAFEAGCFIVSGFDEERFSRDAKYREMVILNVFTPSRLKNSRRTDIAYPYIGSVTPSGDFENDFEIAAELNNMQKQR